MVAESDRSLPRRLFFALGIRNYRLYFIGQLVSVSGTWMQRVAQAWLVLSLTGSGTAVGGLTALQFLPILVLAPLGGVIADRVDKRRLLYVTQSLAGAIAATLGLLIVTDRVELWMVYAMAFALGLVACVDNPARQAFIIEMVGRDRLTNAVSLNSVLVNAARVFGPALGGVLIVTVGIGTCFLINAASYLALITALVVMRDAEMVKAEPSPRGRGQVRQGLRYAARTPRLIVPLVMLAVIGIFSYEYSVILPLLARFTFGGDANTFGIMFTAIGIGAVAGGLKTGARTEYRAATLSLLAGALGIALAVVAAAPNLWVALIALAGAGAAGTSFLALTNSMLQLTSAPEMRGRVLALRAVAFIGARPIGAPIIGWVGEHIGPRAGVGLGAIAALTVAALAYRRLAATDRTEAQTPPYLSPSLRSGDRDLPPA